MNPATATVQSILISSNGRWFSNNDLDCRPTGNRARTLAALILYARVGRDYPATYEQLVSFVWPETFDKECSFPRGNFASRKAVLGESISWLRDNGLQEAIRTRHGVGYYWSPSVKIAFLHNDSPPPAPISIRSKQRHAVLAKQTLAQKFKEVSHQWAGKLDRRELSPKKLAPLLAELGFRKADIARLYGVSRAAVQDWKL